MVVGDFGCFEVFHTLQASIAIEPVVCGGSGSKFGVPFEDWCRCQPWHIDVVEASMRVVGLVANVA